MEPLRKSPETPAPTPLIEGAAKEAILADLDKELEAPAAANDTADPATRDDNASADDAKPTRSTPRMKQAPPLQLTHASVLPDRLVMHTNEGDFVFELSEEVRERLRQSLAP